MSQDENTNDSQQPADEQTPSEPSRPAYSDRGGETAHEPQRSSGSGSQGGEASWQSAALMHIATASIEEQRRGRRWRIFIVLAFLAFLWVSWSTAEVDTSQSMLGGFDQLRAPAAPSLAGSGGNRSNDHVALVELKGVIFDSQQPDGVIRPGSVLAAMESASKNSNCKGILLSIDSPGGGVHQTVVLLDAIKKFRKENPDLPIVAMAQSITMSGGVYAAMGADKFFAHKNSLVGSIGVLISMVGLEKTIEKIGAERRIIASGPNKAILDPLSPFPPEHRQRIQDIVDELQREFIHEVKLGRGDRLVGDEGELFSGAFWTASRALEYGLIDGISNVDGVVEQEFGLTNIVDYTIRPNPWDKFFYSAGVFVGLADSISSSPLLGKSAGLAPGDLGAFPGIMPLYMAR